LNKYASETGRTTGLFLKKALMTRSCMEKRTNKSTSPYHPPSNPPPPPKEGERKESPFKDFSTRGDVIVTDNDGEYD